MVKTNYGDYYRILTSDYPEWLDEYILTPRMQKQTGISVTCGTIYTDLFPNSETYTSLDHSIAVALIVWNCTHDKKQTISALLHDIATPAFKHCVDFMNGDYMNQESTEELTTKLIEESSEIMALLKRDNISVSEVDNYHMYPIADNDTPQLSADRLEYSLSNSSIIYPIKSFEAIKEIYNDIEIQTNPQGEPELGFKTKKSAREFVKTTSKLSVIYRDERTRYSMQFVADILRKLSEDGLISVADLYEKPESEIIQIIEQSKYGEIFDIWRKSKKLKQSKEKPKNVYFVHHPAKIRYIDPLYKGERISKQCKIAAKAIEKNMAYDMDFYVFQPEIAQF
jgi:hypothetical protein